MKFASVNPHDPRDVVGEWEAASEAEVAGLVTRARLAAREWGSLAASARSEGLSAAAAAVEGRADELALMMVREVGKPLSEAKAEVNRGIAILRYNAQLAMLPEGELLPAGAPAALLLSRRRPVGVVALVTPWNFPVAIPLWKAAPCLAYGNSALLKPSRSAAATALLLQAIIAPHLPDDVFLVVLGGAKPARILANHFDVAAVSFTGSVPVGREIAQRVTKRGGCIQAEMGGQNPALILADADAERAASAVAYAAMGYAGQKCTATSRVIVEKPIYDEFADRLVAAVEALKVTDPGDPRTLVGPVIDDGALGSALTAIDCSGGEVLTGGRRLDGNGFYLSPTLVALSEPSGPLATDEVFAPVAALLRAETKEEAVRIANSVRFGLVASVFTTDLNSALRLPLELETGMVKVNAPTSGVDFHAPFGGVKDSSSGPREQGLAARDFYTKSQTVTIVP